jgi:hypothetical protein
MNGHPILILILTGIPLVSYPILLLTCVMTIIGIRNTAGHPVIRLTAVPYCLTAVLYPLTWLIALFLLNHPQPGLGEPSLWPLYHIGVIVVLAILGGIWRT